MSEFTFTLNSPITEEEWDAITDVDFDHTNSITVHTKHGKEVTFYKQKAEQWIPFARQEPKDGQMVIVCMPDGYVTLINFSDVGEKRHLVAWMPLPEPYKEEGGKNG